MQTVVTPSETVHIVAHTKKKNRQNQIIEKQSNKPPCAKPFVRSHLSKTKIPIQSPLDGHSEVRGE